MIYLAVGLSWVASIVCCTVLILNGEPVLGLLVLIIGCLAQARQP